MTTKAGYYGSDDTSNTFLGGGEKWFTLVDEKLGDTDLYQTALSDDNKVGTIFSGKSRMEFNPTWYGGNLDINKEWVNKNLDTVMRQGEETARKGIWDSDPSTTTEAARNKANTLLKKNKANEAEESSGELGIPSGKANEEIGPAQAGTREKADSFGVHVFPTSLRTGNDGQDFMKIDMMAFKPRSIEKGRVANTLGIADRTGNRETLGSVILPIPGGIQDSQQVRWTADSINPVQLAVSSSVLAAVEGSINKGFDTAADYLKTALESPDTKKALGTYLAGQAAGSQNLLTRTTGAVLNPNMELLFNSPDLRNFTFSFLLAPRSEAEAMTVVRIIRFFKQGMAPIRSKSRLFLKSPHTFRLAYKNTASTGRTDGFGVNDHPYLNKFKECAMQSFGVNYTPNGQYSTYEDGVMTAYQVTMNFQEMTPIYNDDYGDSGNIVPARIGH